MSTAAKETPLYASAFEGLKYAYSLGKSNDFNINLEELCHYQYTINQSINQSVQSTLSINQPTLLTSPPPFPTQFFSSSAHHPSSMRRYCRYPHRTDQRCRERHPTSSCHHHLLVCSSLVSNDRRRSRLSRWSPTYAERSVPRFSSYLSRLYRSRP